MIIKLIFFFFCYGAFGAYPPVVLEEGRVLGHHLDILEDPGGKLTISDVNRPEWENKFVKSRKKIPSFGHIDVYKTGSWFRRCQRRSRPGGNITVSSKVDERTLFTIELPIGG